MSLIAENYFSPENNLKYLGASQFKAFCSCSAAALAELNGEYERETSTSLLVGSYVDAHFEGTLDIFQAKHPEIFTKSGSLKADYAHAEYIIERIERDLLFMEHMNGKKQVIMTGEIRGVPVKIKVDVLHEDKIVDLKIMKDFKPIWNDELHDRQNFIEAWGYDIQGAIYQEVVRQNIGQKLPFIIAAATKEKEPDIGLFEIPQPDLDYAMQIVMDNINRIARIKIGAEQPERCGKCNYCRRTKKLTAVVNYGEMN